MSDAPKFAIEFGWGAPTIGQQFPDMDAARADHFQRDHEDLSRLKIRGVITRTEHASAIQRLAKNIWRAAMEKEKADE
jgi:hypothetical protein